MKPLTALGLVQSRRQPAGILYKGPTKPPTEPSGILYEGPAQSLAALGGLNGRPYKANGSLYDASGTLWQPLLGRPLAALINYKKVLYTVL